MNTPSDRAKFADRPREEVVRIIRESGLVDERWYGETYRDVADGGLDPVAHYVDHGADEGRNPNSHFDTRWYLKTYADVRAAGVNPLLHYAIDGAKEGRRTSPTFDTAYYVAQNPDVGPHGLNPLVHYLRSGLREGRSARSYPFGPTPCR